MPVDIEEVIEKAFEQAFSKALDQVVQKKAEEIFAKALQDGTNLSRKLQDKIEEGFQEFVNHRIRWDRKKPGFKK